MGYLDRDKCSHEKIRYKQAYSDSVGIVHKKERL